jgi:hypothetical protein
MVMNTFAGHRHIRRLKPLDGATQLDLRRSRRRMPPGGRDLHAHGDQLKEASDRAAVELASYRLVFPLRGTIRKHECRTTYDPTNPKETAL